MTNWPAPLYWRPAVADNAQAVSAASPGNPALLVFVAIAPCRVMDTRQGQGFTGAFGPPSIAAGLPVRTIPIQSSTNCAIPSSAQAYSFNVTVVPPGGLLYITLYPATANPQPQPPNSSTLNDPSGTIIANAAIVPAGTDGNGSVDVFSSSATDLIIDINGYYTSASDLTIAQGSVTAPSVNFTGDSGTGIYSPGAGVINLSAAGTQALSIGNANQATAVGVGAMAVNTGSFNTALGYGALQANTTGAANTAVGDGAMFANTTGSHNTATGTGSLAMNTSGATNAALGQGALHLNTTGSDNTAIGYSALFFSTTANFNTAVGSGALDTNTTGAGNTAVGAGALSGNTTANNNSAFGQGAMYANTTGCNNAAFGQNALTANTTSCGNSAFGAGALSATTGTEHVAVGTGALGALTGGVGDIAIGWGALGTATSGNNNIAIGTGAGRNVTGNANNIHIGSQGSSSDNNTIRIGTQGTQTSFFAAGVRGVTTGNNDALPVMIDSAGQLGTVSSSGRFKEDIRDMGDASRGLLQLRPVMFRYRQPFADGSKPAQYGLIAEEVEKVYPELVAHSADGQIESVKYQVLDSMLLNELQKQAQTSRQQAEEIQVLKERLAALEALLPNAERERR